MTYLNDENEGAVTAGSEPGCRKPDSETRFAFAGATPAEYAIVTYSID